MITTCKDFLDNCQFDSSFDGSMSMNEYIDSPEVGKYYEKKAITVIVTVDGDQYEITDPENINIKYPVRIEL